MGKKKDFQRAKRYIVVPFQVQQKLYIFLNVRILEN
jgi:hypothetical protein